jgi:hypothetical protein
MQNPDIFLFNPTCDFATANNTVSWQPNLLLQQMEREMGNLPQFLCKPGDIVLVQELPSSELLDKLKDAGFTLPSFLSVDKVLTSPSCLNGMLGNLRPWGWSPAVHHLLQPIKPLCQREFSESPIAEWKPAHRTLFSRETARELLKNMLTHMGKVHFIDVDFLPQACSSPDEVDQLTKKWGKIMVKMPWSSSGRGLQAVTRIPVHPSVKQRISGMLRSQGQVFVEPLHKKIQDLGFLYDITSEGIKFLGCSRFFTTLQGQYRGNYLNGYPPDTSPELKTFLIMAENTLPEIHLQALSDMKIRELYEGPLGIDTLIFENKDGSYVINPCLEINWRYTMGHVALQLERHIESGSTGTFYTYHCKEKPFSDFVSENMKNFPLISIDGKLASGFLPLTEYTHKNVFGAFMQFFNSRGSASS